MLNSEILENQAHYPPGFRRDFDAHIYYTAQTREHAFAVRERALRDFAGQPYFIGRMVDRLVGPHPTPMFEIDFPDDRLGEMVTWLTKHRGELRVLVHPVTGDDPKDHMVNPIWLGPPLVLDESKLDPSPVAPLPARESELSL